MKTVEDYVTSIPDFPEPGIIFRDITSVIQDSEGLQLAIAGMEQFLAGVDFDLLAGTGSGVFVCVAPIARGLKNGFGRLP